MHYTFPMQKTTFTLFLAAAGLWQMPAAFAASYDTLPKHVNTLVVKQVMASKIESKYGAESRPESLDLKEEFTSSRLEDVSTVIKSYFDQLKTISPEAYNNFSLGEFKADVEANVTAQGIGYGFGVTDRLTIYASVPVYHIKTDIKFSQTKPGNLAAVQATLRNTETESAMGKFVRDLTLQLPNTNEELLQSLVVNYYNYEPIGTWEKDALGDAEIGFIYRLTDFDNSGMAISMGAVLPTGDADNPDSLQDVSTGDGQYDGFVESMAGFGIFEKTLQFDVKGRYTYQFAGKKEVRWIEDADVPLSRDKKTVKEKLGNKIDAAATITLNPTHWLNFNSSYIVSRTAATRYDNIEDRKVKEALESNTDSEARWIKVGMGLSTIEAYKRKKFDMPFEIGVSAQRLLNARNSANYERIDVDLKLFF